MIYLITGVPGSGKSLYAVSTLIQQLMKETITRDDGTELKRRLVVDGIPNLLLEHELMATCNVDEKGLLSCPEGDGLNRWYEWCKPGDLLVVDEVQRYWRGRAMGTRPPEHVAKLETHRHLGVDFVIITQNPMLLDQNVRRLVGGHRHVRRLFGMNRAIIYEWDGCQADTNRVSGAVTKTYFGYPKSAYSLYKSSELHTKQKHKKPAWLAVPVLALLGGLWAIPQAYGTLSSVAGGKGLTNAPALPASAPRVPVAVLPPPVSLASAVVPPLLPASSPASALALVPPLSPASAPQFAGCVAHATRCACYDNQGAKVDKPADYCVSSTAVNPSPLGFVAHDPNEGRVVGGGSGYAESTGQLLADMRAYEGRR